MTVHPNPARQIVFIDSKKVISKIELFDVTGSLQNGVTLQGDHIDLENINSGVFMLRVYSGATIKNVKLLKE